MAAINSVSNLIQLLTDGASAQHPHVYIDNRMGSTPVASHVIGELHSLWGYNKSNGARGLVPTTPEAPTRLTQGALKQANAGSGKELRLIGAEVCGAGAGVLTIYDRLLHMGGLSGTSTLVQTVGGSITRNTSGVGNQIWVEVYTILGSNAATTIVANYTNQSGVSKTTWGVAIGGAGKREADRIIRLPLADGDSGVQSVQSVQLAGSTGSAGNFGITIARPIARVFLESQGTAAFRDFLTGTAASAPIIDSDACIAFVWEAGQTSSPRVTVALNLVES